MQTRTLDVSSPKNYLLKGHDSKHVTFQLAEVAVTRNLFAAILARIERLAMPPPVAIGYRRVGA